MRTLGVRRSSHVSSPASWRSLQRSKLQGLSAGSPCRLVSLGSMGLKHSVSLLYDVSWSVGAGAPNRRSTSGQRSSSNHFPHPQSRHDLNWRRRRRGHGKPRIRTEKSDDRREIDEWFTRHHTEHRRGSDTTEGLSSFLLIFTSTRSVIRKRRLVHRRTSPCSAAAIYKRRRNSQRR